jgi:hypothetical protein
MAEMEELVRAALLTFNSVTALVGTGSSARIRADNLRQGETLPAIIIEIDDERYPNDLTGTSGRMYDDVNLICRDTTRKKSRALATAVRLNGTDPGTGLHGYGGTVLSTRLDAWLEDIVPSRTPRDDKSDRRWYDVNMSFQCTALVTA